LVISISRDLCIYRQQDVALLHGYGKIFPKQTKSQTILELYLFRKNQITWNTKPKLSIFVTSALGSNLLCFGSLMFFLPFHASNTLELQISSCYLLPWFCSKTVKTELFRMPNRTVRFFQTCQIWSSTHASLSFS
jgi:hypothetical protein